MDNSLKELDIENKQFEILNQFRSNLEDILTPLHTDAVLLKFLRARNFILEDAEDNFRAVDATKKFYGLDTTLETYVYSELCLRYGGDTFLGFAKDGTAVRYITARADFIGFLHSMSAYEMSHYFSHQIELDLQVMREENIKTGRNCDEITYIIDMEGYSVMDFTYKCVIESGLDNFRLFQDFFPEVWRNIIFVNDPAIFNKIFYIFKPILKDALVRKLQFATKSSTAELLRKYVDDDVLPAFLGGKRVDSKGDPYCREFVRNAGKIPDSYYLKNVMRFIQATDPGVKVAVIGPRSVLNIPVVVREAGLTIRMEVRSENGSVSFATLYRDFGSDPENPDLPTCGEHLDPHDKRSNVRVVGIKQKMQTHLAPVDGDSFTTKPGVYILQFDNTSSWFGSRKLFYRITTTPGIRKTSSCGDSAKPHN